MMAPHTRSNAEKEDTAAFNCLLAICCGIKTDHSAYTALTENGISMFTI